MKTYRSEAKFNEVDIFQSSIFDAKGEFIAHAYGQNKDEAEKNADLIVKGLESNRQPLIDFTDVVRPVIKWLNDNCHPHVTVIITPTNAELTEGLQSTGRIMDYVKD